VNVVEGRSLLQEKLVQVFGILAFLDVDSELLRACLFAVGHGPNSTEARKPGVYFGA
jgi:hypothetical protein